MKLRDLDLGWLTVIAAGLFAHANNACLAGFCGDPSTQHLQVDLPFVLFVLTIITFIADHNWYPRSLKKPHGLIVLFFNIMAALTMSNLAVGFVWAPLQDAFHKINTCVAGWLNENMMAHEKHSPPSASSQWQEYFTNFIEHHGDNAVPSPLLHFSQEDVDVAHALLQWTDESLSYTLSMAVALLMLGSRFFAAGFWDQLRQGFVLLQSWLRRRRGRILLLPGGSLARLRSLAPRYVLRKVDDSEEECGEDASGKGGVKGGAKGGGKGGAGGGAYPPPPTAPSERRDSASTLSFPATATALKA